MLQKQLDVRGVTDASESAPGGRACRPRWFAATRIHVAIGLLSVLFISVLFIRPPRAHADEKSDLIARLRGAAAQRFPSDDYELWKFGFQEKGGMLAEIGLLQLGLGDLEGARVTAKSLPRASDCMNCGDSYREFLKEVSAALVRAAKTDEAMQILKGHQKDDISTDQWLAIAKAQADRGDRDAARASCAIAAKELSEDHGCQCGPPDVFDLPQGLVTVAFGQAAIGDVAGARKTCERIDALLAKAPKKGIKRTIVVTRLAVGYAKLGDRAIGRRLLQNAPGTINYEHPTQVDSLNLEGSWRYIAEGLCRLGDFDAAPTAVSKSGDRQREACPDVAIYLWSQGQIAEAKKTILASPQDELGDLVLIEIAKDQARARGAEGDALETVGHIKKDLYRALGTLEVAACLAQQGKREFARTIARKLNYPVVNDLLRHRVGPRFKFDDIETWNQPYESTEAFSHTSMSYAEAMEGDLLAAAVRCRSALDGPGAIRFNKRMKESAGWDVRKAAKAQASEGDASGALAWSDNLTPERRLGALIGAAEGYLEYKSNPPANPPAHRRLERHHPLSWISLGHFYGDY